MAISSSTSTFSTHSITSHWLFTIRCTTMIQWLYQMKCPYNISGPTAEYVTFRRLKILQYTLAFIDMLRAFYLSDLLNSSHQVIIDHLPYNPLFTSLALQLRFLTADTLKAATSLGVFAIHIDYILSIHSDAYLITFVQQLFNENSRELFKLNNKILIKPKARYYQLLKMREEYVQLGKILWNESNSLKFKSLPLFENVSTSLRGRLIVINAFCNWIFSRLLVVLALILASFLVGYIILVYDKLSLPLLVFGSLDFTFVLYITWNTIRMGLFLIQYGILPAIFCNGHITQLTIELRRAFSQSQLFHLKYCYLQQFYREYRFFRHFSEYANRQFISPLMAVVFLSNISINVIMLSYLLFGELFPGEMAALILLCSAQIILPLEGAAALVKWSKCFYTPERTLYWVQYQLALGGPQADTRLYRRVLQTTAKVKLMTFYELVCTKKRFRFTVGPFGYISNKSLYEFFFAYSCMVMYVSKIVRKHQQHIQQQ